MTDVQVFDNQVFKGTGHMVVENSFTMPVTANCTAIVSANSQGDSYARYFDVYVDGVQKKETVVADSINDQVALDILEQGTHKLGLVITTFVGQWMVSAKVHADTVDSVVISPVMPTAEADTVEPDMGLSDANVFSPPVMDAPASVTNPNPDTTPTAYIATQPLTRVATQEDIDRTSIDTVRSKVTAEEGPKPWYLPDITPPTQVQEILTSILSVNGIGDRTKDGLLPSIDLSAIPSQLSESVSQIPQLDSGELSKLVGAWTSHKDDYGRNVFTANAFGQSFDIEPIGILAGMGVALVAATAYIKRNEIMKLLQR
jgi:hypothetical protein